MNEPRSSRYHRTRRRAIAAELAATTALLTALLLTGGSARLRDLAGASAAGYVCLLALLLGLVTLPFVWYRGFHLERQYELSSLPAPAWFRDYLKAAALRLALGAACAEAMYLAIRTTDRWWWLLAAGGGAVLLAVLTALAPVWLLPMFHRSRPLGRERLRRRLLELSARAGVPVMNVHEWGLGEKSRRVNAALVGAGATRRILLSDTLLAGYSDDEIEVVMAHELGHHVHRDVTKALAAEFVVLSIALYVAHLALGAAWQSLGFRSAADVAGLPLVLLAAGAVSFAATPVLNAWSRRNERRADRFALELTAQPHAFIATMKRMAAQNLAEENPTRTARWFFNTHPSVEERIAEAKRMLDGSA